MTVREAYRLCEQLYLETDWTDQDAVDRFNDAVAELNRLRAEGEG